MARRPKQREWQAEAADIFEQLLEANEAVNNAVIGRECRVPPRVRDQTRVASLTECPNPSAHGPGNTCE